MMKGRNNQTARIIKIISWIESSRYGLSVREIHGRLKQSGEPVSIRTIYRDIEAINLAGLPITEEQGICIDNERRWKIEKGQSIKSRALMSERDLVALYLTTKGLLNHIDEKFLEPLSMSLKMAENSLTPREWSYYQSLGQIIEISENPVPAKAINWSHLETLIGACLDSDTLSTTWHAQNRELKDTHIPKKIQFANGGISYSCNNRRFERIPLCTVTSIELQN